MHHATAIVVLLLPFFALSGCATIYNPATEQREFIFITTPVEVSIGNMVASKISRQFKISKDRQKNQRVKNIGREIIDVSDRKDLQYHLNVIEEKSLNGFTTPGGYIYINSGLLEKATDDELACILGHEIGHVAARHIAKKLQAQIGYDLLMNLVTHKVNLGELQRAASISYNLILLGYSREDELLADRLGVKYAYKAGYDPYAMITFLEKLKDTEKEELGFIFLRSHPYISQRIKMLKMQIPIITERADRDKTYKNSLPASVDKRRPKKVMCPVCRKIFSGRLNYCPYDGTKLL